MLKKVINSWTMNKNSSRIIIFSLIVLMIILLGLFFSKNTNNYKHRFTQTISEKNKIDRVFKKYNTYTFGIDFSHYQGKVDWTKIKNIYNDIPISFVFLRATMGTKRKDKYFKYNWSEAKKHTIKVGAYHYYRPNENSTKQASNFIKNVKLEKGDLPPVLDIEKLPTKQSLKSLKIGLINWLTIIEKHYGVKPIIYSGDTFYRKHLSSGEFDNYTIWIANFNNVQNPKTKNWEIWQFSEKGIVQGVNEKVDLNVFKGSYDYFEKLLVK